MIKRTILQKYYLISVFSNRIFMHFKDIHPIALQKFSVGVRRVYGCKLENCCVQYQCHIQNACESLCWLVRTLDQSFSHLIILLLMMSDDILFSDSNFVIDMFSDSV